MLFRILLLNCFLLICTLWNVLGIVYPQQTRTQQGACDREKTPTLTVGIFQCASVFGDKTANLNQMEATSRKAQALGIELVIFPELYLTGYTDFSLEKVRQMAEFSDGPSFVRASSIAQKYNVSLAYGYVEKDENGTMYDSAMLINQTGDRLLNYRKTHPTDIERYYFAEGSDYAPVVDLNGIKISLLICFDISFPEASRVLALNNAEFIIIGTANGYPAELNDLSKKVTPTRAGENMVYVAYVNFAQTNGSIPFYGLSRLCDPTGADVLVAGSSSTELLFADICPQMFNPNPNPFFKEFRRPEIDGKICQIY
ncbi:nitrilase [Anaeramoeba ignava]|uniref:Nitrilase n=1 Tax=Anaeramoeba ignava TaxID=1746090 RepID=A0A9Q0LRW2_ANAIG|nr:nitrilase [Anaeramoeba ignava]